MQFLFCRPAAALAVFALAASAAVWTAGGASAQEILTARPVPGPLVDVGRVNQDFAAAAQNKSRPPFDFSARSKAGFPQSPVPLFVPPDLLSDFSKRTTADKSGSANGSLKASDDDSSSLIIHPDGYIAARAYAAFDLVVRGTSQVFATAVGSKSAPTIAADYFNPFSQTESGGEIGFGYAGGSYVAEFECRVGGANCVSAEQAQKIVDELLACDFGGTCIDKGAQLIRRR